VAFVSTNRASDDSDDQLDFHQLVLNKQVSSEYQSGRYQVTSQ
jgi:hypothetical protein